MRVAVLSDEKLVKKIAGFNVDTFPWDGEKLEDLNLRDYDGVILDLTTYNSKNKIDSNFIISKVISPAIAYDIIKSSPSFYVVIGDPSLSISGSTVIEHSGFEGSLVSGKGTSLAVTDAGKKSIYSDYLKEIKSYEYSYELELDTVADIKRKHINKTYDSFSTIAIPLMESKSGYMTAFAIQCRSWERSYSGGEMRGYYLFDDVPVFLPSHPLGSKYAVESVLRLNGVSGSSVEVPEWLEQVTVHGQEEIDLEIAKKQNSIIMIENELDELRNNRLEIRKILDMLYLANKPLEEALKKSFTENGFKVFEPKSSDHVEFYLKYAKYEFVTEVKSGNKANFNKDGLRQVIEWKDNESLDTGKEYKPLLILSNEYTKPPEDRNQDVLDENLIKFAVSRSVVVVTVTLLYQLLEKLRDKQITAGHIAKVLHENSGLLNIEDFDTIKP